MTGFSFVFSSTLLKQMVRSRARPPGLLFGLVEFVFTARTKKPQRLQMLALSPIKGCQEKQLLAGLAPCPYSRVQWKIQINIDTC